VRQSHSAPEVHGTFFETRCIHVLCRCRSNVSAGARVVPVQSARHSVPVGRASAVAVWTRRWRMIGNSSLNSAHRLPPCRHADFLPAQLDVVDHGTRAILAMRVERRKKRPRKKWTDMRTHARANNRCLRPDETMHYTGNELYKQSVNNKTKRFFMVDALACAVWDVYWWFGIHAWTKQKISSAATPYCLW